MKKEILSKYDEDDHDVVRELIPLFYSESLEEYNKSFNTFDVDKSDLRFIISDKIFWFLIDDSGWENVDIELVADIVDDYYGK